MAAIRLPISNQLTGDLFTLKLAVGSGPTLIDVILDTGSTLLTVSGLTYDAAADAKAVTSQVLQTEQLMTGTAVAAVVVHTPVGVAADGEGVAITVPDTALAVVRSPTPGLFGAADGLFGLAYPGLGKTYQMAGNTWQTPYTAADVAAGKALPNLGSYIDQMAAKGLSANVFAFSVRRSLASQASEEVNRGIFVLGGGTDCTDLYNGAFQSAAVVHEDYYAVNLTSIQVGAHSIEVPPAAAGGPAPSNAIIDSGMGGLMLSPALFQQVIALFNAVNPTFGPLLTSCSADGSGSYDQTKLATAGWPLLTLTFQGAGGGHASVTIHPQDYWQTDNPAPGQATSQLRTSGNSLNGRSLLGLPLLANHFVVFDRTGGPGRGAIRFASAVATGEPLVA